VPNGLDIAGDLLVCRLRERTDAALVDQTAMVRLIFDE
jgi:hypothetical protein